jgi:diguanylate cyclase (GGDEF)-like protein
MPMNLPLHVLWAGPMALDLSTSDYGPFVVQACATLDEAAQALREAAHDALVLWLAPGMAPTLADWQALSHAVLDAAVVVVAPDLSPALAMALTHRGVQDLLPAPAADAETLARVLRLATERKRLERVARKAFATDLSTGLPNHAQLLEHMTHLLALREREPAPMALLVLRIEGLSTTEAHLGAEAANVLRRKVAVRLRAGLRASDVVASIGADAFAVLLAWIDAPAAGMRVASKLVQSLQKSFSVAGHERTVAVSAGVSQYPEHGKQAEELLRRAIGQATGMAAVGRAGFSAHVERGPGSAANDEGPDTVL